MIWDRNCSDIIQEQRFLILRFDVERNMNYQSSTPYMQKLILVGCNSHSPVKQQVHNQDNPFQVLVVHG